MTMRTLMKTATMRAWGAGLFVIAAAVPAAAHHSFAGEYDGNKAVNVTGTVTKSEWTNPHARFYVDVKEANGSITKWEFELGSPNLLIRYGFTRDMLVIGSQVSVEGYQARDGSKIANAKTVKFADGKVLSAGSSAALVDTK